MTESTRAFQRDQLVNLSVTSLAFGGKGVAKLDDFVIFVTGAVPGDVVTARITKSKKRYAEARVEELITPSPDRCPARCSMFGTCGGCVWQDLAYEVQLKYKASQVRESLEHLGGLKDFELRPILGMESPWRYRNRADFSIGMSEAGAVVGFRPPGSWDRVLPLSECHLVDTGIESVRASVEGWLRDNGLAGWNPRTGEGFARHLLARTSQGGQELLISLVTADAELPDHEGLVEFLRAKHPQLVGIAHAVNNGRAELSAGLPYNMLWGRPYLLEKLRELTLKISLDAFFQTNTQMAERLYALVSDEVKQCTQAAAPPGGADPATVPSAGTVIWDLCSGVGSIGLTLADQASEVLGIEFVPGAVEDAGENARLNHIDNASFLVGDVAKVLREVADGLCELPSELATPDIIVVDPPRAGLSNKAISRIGEVGAPTIVYVSCNPATLGPNAAQFQQYGYTLQHVTPVDMFPHTPHVECVALLTRAEDWEPELDPGVEELPVPVVQ
jgi:23S rRNA (uracil1939-C5)-methyltransferase